MSDKRYLRTPAIKKVELLFRQHLLKFKEYLRQEILKSESWENFSHEVFEGCLDYVERYFEIFDRYQELVIKQYDEKIYCGSNCSNCCHHYPMSVEPFELLYLYKHLKTRDDFFEILEKCYERVQSLNKIQTKELPKDFVKAVETKHEISIDKEDLYLQYFYMQEKPCPMLNNDGNCGVYMYRPLICRMYLSITPAKYCTPKTLLSDKNKNFTVSLPDEIEEDIGDISELLSFFGLTESLFEGLVELNKLESSLTKNS